MEIKVPFYNVVNIFLPGLVLIGSCVLLFLDEVEALVIKITDIGSAGLEVLVTVSLFAIAYEVGYILFRLGSVLVEPIHKKAFKWEYSDFIKAGKTNEKAYDKLEMLSREYGFARTQIILFIVLVVLTIIQSQWWFVGICIICLGLLVLTIIGHMKRLQDAVAHYLTIDVTKSEGDDNG